MKTKKLKIIFEEGCFDNLEEEFTQEELDDLIESIKEQVESGEFFDNATPVSELPEEEQEEIYNMINNKKNTRQ